MPAFQTGGFAGFSVRSPQLPPKEHKSCLNVLTIYPLVIIQSCRLDEPVDQKQSSEWI